MADYYVNTNAQANGDHEVHVNSCTRLPAPDNRRYLGNFPTCHDAVRKAKTMYAKSNGCAFCSPACNTG